MSGLYATTQEAMVTGTFTWAGGSFELMLVGTGYTPDYATDVLLTDIPSGSQLLTAPVPLADPTVVSGACGASGYSWPHLSTTEPIMGVAIVRAPVAPATVPTLVLYIDQGEGFGQPGNGLAASITWDARGIFAP